MFEVQVEVLASVLAQLHELKRHEGPSPFNTRKSTCKCLVPVLLGTSRAMARWAPRGNGDIRTGDISGYCLTPDYTIVIT